MPKFYLTTPIYYVNSKPHVGHAYTTISADVIARYYRMTYGTDNVFFLTGTDEHGIKIMEIAQKQNMEAKAFCDKVSSEFKTAWENLDISYNHFMRTTDESHVNFVIDFNKKLYDSGYLYKDNYEALYCIGCEKFLTEKELVDGKCPDHLREPEKVSESNWFFDLKKFLPQVQKMIETNQIEILPAKAKNELLGLFKQGMENFSVTREKDKYLWGIEVPWDPGQLFYVWFDALENYLSAVDTDKWWPADLHILGRDILKFHAIYWPAMLLAAGYEMPKKLFIHGYFTVNGQKMSKTIGNVIDPNALVTKYGIDGTKYLLLSQFPFGNDGDIEAEKFTEKYNAVLANGLGNLYNRVLTLCEKNFDSIVPQADTIEELKHETEKIWETYTFDMENTLRLDNCLNSIRHLVEYCDQTISKVELWKLIKEDKELGAKYIYSLMEVLRHLSWLVKPFLHNTSENMQKQLNIFDIEKTKYLSDAKKWGQLTTGNKISKGEVLFLRK